MPSNGNNNTRSKAPNYKTTANTTGNVLDVFSRRMKEERIKKGLTQQELADLANVSLKTVKRYESGAKAMQLEVAYNIANALDISLQRLLPANNQNAVEVFDEVFAMLSTLREQYVNQ